MVLPVLVPLAAFAAAAKSVNKSANTIKSLGDNYFKSNKAWKAFPSQVLLLTAKRDRLEIYLPMYSDSPLANNSDLEALQEVDRLVKEQVNDLKKRKAAIAGRTSKFIPWFWRFGEMVFPEQIGQGIEIATKALENIIEHFKAVREQEDSYMLRSAALTRCHSLTSANHNADSYVSREDMEAEIYNGLGMSVASSPSAVSVHGEGGEGKSVASSPTVVSRHGKDRKGKSIASSPTVLSIYGPGGIGKSTVARHMGWELRSEFDRVFLLQCSGQADVSAAQTELLQRLQGEDFSSDAFDMLGPRHHCRSSSIQAQSGLRERLLQSLLRDDSWKLIILDDVSESGFVRDFLELSGENVKYIVTSRRDICKDLSYKCIPIAMAALKPDEQMRILAVHAGFLDQSIPPRYKSAAKKILHQAHGLPLAIATLGARVERRGNGNLGVWEGTAAESAKGLYDKPSKHVHNTGYDHTVRTVTMQNYNACDKKSRQLLLLRCMCRDSSISESTLQYLFNRAFITDRCTNGQCHADLKDLKVGLKSWKLVHDHGNDFMTLHPLTKKIILREMNEEVNEIAAQILVPQQTTSVTCKRIYSKVQSLAGCFHGGHDHLKRQDFRHRNWHYRFTIVLGCLYFEPGSDFAQQIVSQTGYSAELFSELKRSTVEPITDLLVTLSMLPDDYMRIELCKSAIEVFLDFICRDMLNHRHILRLLELESSDGIMTALRFLEKASLLENSIWEKISMKSISRSLAKVLKGATHSDIQVQAARTISALLVCNAETRTTIVGTPGVIDHLLLPVSHHQNPGNQVNAARLLCRTITSCANDSTILNQIANFPKLLDVLEASLSKPAHPVLQSEAARALADLAFYGDQSIKDNIFLLPGLLDTLISSLVQEKNVRLATEAAAAVGSLVANQDCKRKLQLAKVPKLLESLRASLAKRANPALQASAALTLAHLAFGDQSVKEELFHLPGLVDALVQAVAQDQNARLAHEAAAALGNLAASEDCTRKVQLAEVPNLLEILKASLSKAANPALQANAAWALAHLGNDNQSVIERLFHPNISGLLNALITSMAQDQNCVLANGAAAALGNLAASHESTRKLQLAENPSVLTSLWVSLLQTRNPALQTYAAWALAHLSAGNDAVRERLFDFFTLVDVLALSVAQDWNPHLANEAARAIRNLASSHDSKRKLQLAKAPYLLESLSASLSKSANPDLQINAAWALAHLSSGDHSVKMRLFRVPRVLNALLTSVAEAQNCFLAQGAAEALGNLAACHDSMRQEVRRVFPNFLEGLESLGVISLPRVNESWDSSMSRPGDGRMVQLHYV